MLGGEPVFAGTRVPARSLCDHLEAGDSIEQFLEGFPSVKREQVIALLDESRKHVLASGRTGKFAIARRNRQHASRVRSPGQSAPVTDAKQRPGFPIATDLKPVG
ncbi:MAG: DUF433 domain-containing protein [Chthoniobacterales bacterium]